MKAGKIQFVAVPYFTLLVLMAVGAMPSAAQTAETAEEHSGRIRERIEYFNQQRAYPLDRIPTGARLRALEQLRVMRAREAEKRAAEAANPSTTAAAPPATAAWQLIGPQPIDPLQPFDFWGGPTDSGRVAVLAVDPAGLVYLGAAEGGVWKSTDGGATWTPLTDTQSSLAVGSIAIDPTNSQTIYVGTGEGDNAGDAYYGAGILKSTDGGGTWTLLGTDQFKVCGAGQDLTSLFSGSYIASIAVDPTNNQIVLAAVADSCSSTSSGVLRSTDGGATWTNVLSGTGSSVLFSGTTLSGAGIAYAALGDTFGNSANGIYMSTDDGATWNVANGTGTNIVPSGGGVGRIVLAAAPSEAGTLYALFEALPSSFGGVFTTVDGGTNWTKTNAPDFCGSQCSYNVALAVSPVDPKIVYGAGIYTFSTNTPTTVIGSTDGGNTWTNLGNSLGGGTGKIHTDAHALAFTADGGTIYVGSDGGVWSGTPADTPSMLNWTGANATLATAQFYPGFAVNPSDVTRGVGGTQDNGSVVYTGTAQWSNVACGDGGFSAVDDTTTPATFLTACTFSQGIRKSTTPTVFPWSSADTGINKNDPALFIPPMVSERQHPGTLYYGTNRIYKTTNDGDSWVPISPQPLLGTSAKVSAIAVAPSKPKTIYAGQDDGTVAVTTNGGTTWTDITGTGMLPRRYVTSMAVSDKTPTTAYVTYSGFSGFRDSLGHIFKTTDGGATWTDISSNLPNIPVDDLAEHTGKPNTLYAATDIGVFVTTDGGVSWSTLGTGLPNVAVLSLQFHAGGGELFAASHGRSAWKLHVGK